MEVFANTALMIVFRILFSTILSALAAYAFARMEFPFKNLLFVLVLMPMMVPSQIFILPQYLIVSDLGWQNTIKALVIPGMASTFGIFLLRQFFMGIPRELEEAAVLDGCNPGQIFEGHAAAGKIRDSLTGYFYGTFAYKDLLWPLVVNTSVEKMPLSSGLAMLQGQYTTNYPQLMADL